MMAKAPREDASSRSRRAYHENWFINLLVHFSSFDAQRHCAFGMTSMQRRAFGGSRSYLRSSEGDPEKQPEVAPDDNG